jgi:hypothetical protein
VAFVHRSTPEVADPWFARYGLSDVVRVSDPDGALYRAFGLGDATLGRLAHPRVWWPWFRTAILHRHGVGLTVRHWRQLSGVFLLDRGKIRTAIRHRDSAARPDYVALVRAQPQGD